MIQRFSDKKIEAIEYRALYALASDLAQLVEQEVADSLAAVADEPQEAGIDEVAKQDAVARLDLGADRIDRVPGGIGHRKGVAGVAGEPDLRPGQSSIQQAAMK